MTIRLFVLSVLGLTLASWAFISVIYFGAKAIMPNDAATSVEGTTQQDEAVPSVPLGPRRALMVGGAAPVPGGEKIAFEHQACIVDHNDHVSEISDRVAFRGATAVSFRPLYEQRVRVENCNATAYDAYARDCLAGCEEFALQAAAADERGVAAAAELSKPDPHVGLPEDWVCVELGPSRSCFRLSNKSAVAAHLDD